MLFILIRTIKYQFYKNGYYQYNIQLMSDNHLFHLYSVVNTSFFNYCNTFDCKTNTNLCWFSGAILQIMFK